MQEAFSQGHTLGVTNLVIANDNKYVFPGNYDNTVRVWNLDKKKKLS
jgi:WD40 repeat protein